MEHSVDLYSEQDLQAWLKEFAVMWQQRAQASGFTLALEGVMGAGKTTLVRLLAELYGVVGQVSSPSYVLQYEYQVSPDFVIEHWDLYRLGDLPEELFEPAPPSVLRVVEWASKFEDEFVPDAVIRIEFVDGDAGESARRGFFNKVLKAW